MFIVWNFKNAQIILLKTDIKIITIKYIFMNKMWEHNLSEML